MRCYDATGPDERQVEQVRKSPPGNERKPRSSFRSARAPARRGPVRHPHRHGTTSAKVTAALPPSNGTQPQPALALEQVDSLTHQQQRILQRALVIDCVLKADARTGTSQDAENDTRTMSHALVELVEDVIEATRTIGAILRSR